MEHSVLKPMAGGQLGYESEAVDTVLDSAVVTPPPTSRPAAPIHTAHPGRLSRARRRRGPAGRIPGAALRLCGGSGVRAVVARAGHELTLIADRTSYSPGDTATCRAVALPQRARPVDDRARGDPPVTRSLRNLRRLSSRFRSAGGDPEPVSSRWCSCAAAAPARARRRRYAVERRAGVRDRLR